MHWHHGRCPRTTWFASQQTAELTLSVHYGLTTGSGFLVLATGFILPLVSNVGASVKLNSSKLYLVGMFKNTKKNNIISKAFIEQ